MLIGVDYHPSFQQIAFLAEETGEFGEPRLNHSDGEAEKFYRELRLRGVPVRVGMEASGYSRWFERLLAELGFAVCIGDPTERPGSSARNPRSGYVLVVQKAALLLARAPSQWCFVLRYLFVARRFVSRILFCSRASIAQSFRSKCGSRDGKPECR